MDLTFSPKEIAFRDELRTWLADNPPEPEPADGGEDAHYAWRRDWQRRLYDAGWAAPAWPAEYGGRGATPDRVGDLLRGARPRARAAAGQRRSACCSAARRSWSGARDEQKERYLPPILSAEEIWCQGFSEPDAGSDLASLKTRAVKDGDEWVVTGQKVWTSGAQYSKWCMLVARTDPEAAKHKGLTYFLMDMEQDAVQVRPLRQITGEAEFNELFIEEARIPDANVVGGVGNGWKVALTTLMNERAGLGLRAADPPAPAARRPDRRGRRARAARGPAVRRRARRAARALRVDPAARLEGPDRRRKLRPARPGGLAGEVAVVGHQPAADPARRRHARPGGADRRAPAGATSCCAPAATRSRGAPPRCSRTSSPSACSACRG